MVHKTKLTNLNKVEKNESGPHNKRNITDSPSLMGHFPPGLPLVLEEIFGMTVGRLLWRESE